MKILEDQVVYSTFLMIIGIQVWLTISPWERKGKGEGDGRPVNIDQMTHCISPVLLVDAIRGNLLKNASITKVQHLLQLLDVVAAQSNPIQTTWYYTKCVQRS